MILNVFVPILVSITVFLITINMFRGSTNYLEERLKRLDNRKYVFNKNKNVKNDDFFNRVVKPSLEKLANLTNTINKNLISTNNIEQQLLWAGNPYGLSSEQFLGIKVTLFIAFPIITILYFVGLEGINFVSLMLILFSMGFGFFLPDLILKNIIRKRNLQMRKELPSVLDIMSVSSDAGLDFISAIEKMVEKKKGLLPNQFKIVLYDMQVGESRTKALNSLSERCNVDEISRFVNAVNQSEKYGTSISKVLKSQSNFVRQSLKNKSEEKVQKAQSKLILPLVFFALPAVFIIILGPAILEFLI